MSDWRRPTLANLDHRERAVEAGIGTSIGCGLTFGLAPPLGLLVSEPGLSCISEINGGLSIHATTPRARMASSSPKAAMQWTCPQHEPSVLGTLPEFGVGTAKIEANPIGVVKLNEETGT